MNLSLPTLSLPRRAERTLNIEIGDRITKVCYSLPKGKSYQIQTSFMFATPEGSVTDGTILAPDMLASALMDQLQAHGLQAVGKVIFIVNSGKIASREVTLPPVKTSKIPALIKANASDYFPVDISKYQIASSLMERVTEGDKIGCHVSIFAAPLSLLEGFIVLADLVDLQIVAIDYSGNSQYQALKTLAEPAVTMYVNVDCSSSLVSFIQGTKLLLQRSFVFGGDEMIEAHLNAVGDVISYVDALHACSVPLASYLNLDLLSSYDVQDHLSRLVGGVARTMDFFNTNHWDLPVEQVVLMGPCSKLAGLREGIAEHSGINTIHMNELPAIAAFANEADSASLYISCIGSTIDPLALLPEAVKRKTKKQASESIRIGVLTCTACFALISILSAFSLGTYLMAKKEKTNLETQISDLSYVRDTYDLYLQYEKSAGELEALSHMIDNPNTNLTAFYAELEAKMPQQIKVLSMVCTPESVDMNITVPDFKQAAMVLVQLRSFESLDRVTVSDISETESETGRKDVSFSVSCLYPAPPIPPQAETTDAAAQAAEGVS